MMDEEDGEDLTKFEKWLNDKFGEKLMNVIMGIAMVVGIALAVVLFVFVPTWLFMFIQNLVGETDISAYQSLFEGVLKIIIFLAYMWITSLSKDIRRTYEYHGAEHKTIACYEAKLPLTVENVEKQTRFHPRCGTSFIFLVLIISILVYSVFPITNALFMENFGVNETIAMILRVASKLLLLPVIVGISYEIIRLAGKYDNIITRIISTPGLWVQRLTTKEPTPDMLEVAITSTKCALRDEFPEYMEFYKSRAWEREKPSDNEEEGAAEGKSDMDACESGNADVNADLSADNTDNGAPATAGADADIINSGNEDGAQ